MEARSRQPETRQCPKNVTRKKAFKKALLISTVGLFETLSHYPEHDRTADIYHSTLPQAF